ncbi:MAG: amidohydrolase family protein [Acidimicrobiia bacterium]
MHVLTGCGLIVTMDADRRLLTGHAIAIADDGTIADIGREDAVLARYRDAEPFDCGGGWVTPGYVNAHQHLTGDRLVRSSVPDDITSAAAIFDWAVPAHRCHTAADEELSTLAAAVESLSNGVTTVVEAGTTAHPERVAAALDVSGIRASVGTWGSDSEGLPLSGPVDEVIDRQRALTRRFPSRASSRVRGFVALVGHDLMSEDLLIAASALAREAGTMLTFHLSPTPADTTAWVTRSGRRPLARFAELGVLGPHVLIAHAVHVDDGDIDVLVEHDVAVAACPWAYLRLAQGVTRAGHHVALLRRGARVALGCDSENAGDQLDVLRSAALFAGLARDTTGDPTAFTAADAFALATCDGARAIGLGTTTGSIEVARRADIVVHDTTGPNWCPIGDDPYLQLVWGTDGRSVRHVLVDGQIVVRDRRCVTVDVDALRVEMERAAAALRERSGLPIRSRGD